VPAKGNAAGNGGSLWSEVNAGAEGGYWIEKKRWVDKSVDFPHMNEIGGKHREKHVEGVTRQRSRAKVRV
jgi:hypothetical protein